MNLNQFQVYRVPVIYKGLYFSRILQIILILLSTKLKYSQFLKFSSKDYLKFAWSFVKSLLILIKTKFCLNWRINKTLSRKIQQLSKGILNVGFFASLLNVFSFLYFLLWRKSLLALILSFECFQALISAILFFYTDWKSSNQKRCFHLRHMQIIPPKLMFSRKRSQSLKFFANIWAKWGQNENEREWINVLIKNTGATLKILEQLFFR